MIFSARYWKDKDFAMAAVAQSIDAMIHGMTIVGYGTGTWAEEGGVISVSRECFCLQMLCASQKTTGWHRECRSLHDYVEAGAIQEEAPRQLLGGKGHHACCCKNGLQSNLA